MTHLRRVVSKVTQRRLSGFSQPGIATTNAPNPLNTLSVSREWSFEGMHALHHLVSCDISFSHPKFCFSTQPQNSEHDGPRTGHHLAHRQLCSRVSSWWCDGKFFEVRINCHHHFYLYFHNLYLTFISCLWRHSTDCQIKSTARPTNDATIKFEEMVS